MNESRQESAREQELLRRIHAGDKSACAECIELHAPGIYRLALRLMHDERDAEDLVQETFLQAFKAIDSFEGRSELRTWLYRIVYNAAMMRHRGQRPMISVEDALQENGAVTVPEQLLDWCCLPEQDFQTEEMRSQLEQAIRDLPDALRAVFVLRELEGVSTQDCADTLSVSTDVVKQRLHRARLWLRERLSDYFAERI
ncbi:MAG: sigma-70 family RNA polymerase sigma factor [Chloroflexota bacterium]